MSMIQWFNVVASVRLMNGKYAFPAMQSGSIREPDYGVADIYGTVLGTSAAKLF